MFVIPAFRSECLVSWSIRTMRGQNFRTDKQQKARWSTGVTSSHCYSTVSGRTFDAGRNPTTRGSDVTDWYVESRSRRSWSRLQLISRRESTSLDGAAELKLTYLGTQINCDRDDFSGSQTSILGTGIPGAGIPGYIISENSRIPEILGSKDAGSRIFKWVWGGQPYARRACDCWVIVLRKKTKFGEKMAVKSDAVGLYWYELLSREAHVYMETVYYADTEINFYSREIQRGI
jgi:hypothetical protein